MVFKKSKPIENEETPITEEVKEEIIKEESKEEIIKEESKEETSEEEEEVKKQVTLTDVALDHEKRLLQIESRLFRQGGI